MSRFKGNSGRCAVSTTIMTILFVALLTGLVMANGGEGAAEHHVDTHAQMMDLVYRLVNFLVLLGVLIWALKKADLKGVLAARQEGINKSLSEAAEARQLAEQKLVEYEGKLAAASREMDEIQASIRKEAELEKERIIAEAKLAAVKIIEQSNVTAQQEVARAKAELRAEAAKLAVELAEQTLRQKINKDDQNRFVDDYLSKVVKLH